MNNQRNFIYERRDEILVDKNILKRVFESTKDILLDITDEYFDNLKKSGNDANVTLIKNIRETFFIDPTLIIKNNQDDPKKIYDSIEKTLEDEINQKDKIFGHEELNERLMGLYLYLIDKYWQNHLENMEQLRDAVYLRTYSQKNPLIEYKIEGSTIFEELIYKIKQSVVNQIFKIKIETVALPTTNRSYTTNHENFTGFNSLRSGAQPKQESVDMKINSTIVNANKVGRNEPCPCGSGKKYKQCCGK